MNEKEKKQIHEGMTRERRDFCFFTDSSNCFKRSKERNGETNRGSAIGIRVMRLHDLVRSVDGAKDPAEDKRVVARIQKQRLKRLEIFLELIIFCASCQKKLDNCETLVRRGKGR